MAGRSYRVSEVSELSGVTVRALHHYDGIGLVVPSRRSDAGYRLYVDADLLRLQQVLLLRDLGLPLEKIRQMLDDPELDRIRLLREHRERLADERERAEAKLRAVDAALATLEQEETMDPKQIFDGFDPADHEDEVKVRWGDTNAYREASRRTKRYSKDDWAKIQAENRDLMERLAAMLRDGVAAESDEVVELAEAHRSHIDRWYYPCSRAMHAGLAEMYVADERFRASFDQYGEGLADYLSAALRVNAERG